MEAITPTSEYIGVYWQLSSEVIAYSQDLRDAYERELVTGGVTADKHGNLTSKSASLALIDGVRRAGCQFDVVAGPAGSFSRAGARTSPFARVIVEISIADEDARAPGH